MAEAAQRAHDGSFAAACGEGEDWAACLAHALQAMGTPPAGANFGLLYATDALAGDIAALVARLRETTGVDQWIGTVGTGVSVSGRELHDRPALALLIGALPDDSFRIFAPGSEGLMAAHGAWIEQRVPYFGIVHGDPRSGQLPERLADLSAETSCFLVGGLTASRGAMPQVAGEVIEGGLSGALFSPALEVVSGLSQGCTPIGPARVITEAANNVIMTLDERPAIDVFKEDIGELLARDLRRVAGYIYAGFPIADTDTGDYLVRNLNGIDTERGWIGVGHLVAPGERVLFCRRDHAAAGEDLRRMLDDVTGRADRPPRAALYHACVARGPHLFGDNSEELKLLQEALGDLPLVGFFANGEISRDRLYGYTGVLTLIL